MSAAVIEDVQPSAWHQPTYWDEFRCIGAECEDTCCQGMLVAIDEPTYRKYQSCTHAELGPRLQQFVTIRPAPTALQFAAINLAEADTGAQCPFLEEQLCSLQAKLGVDYLSRVCDRYPRVVHETEITRERSLDLSCPEAARVVLSRQEGIGFLSAADGSMPAHWPVRQFLLSVLQNRRYSAAQRVMLAGHVCAKFAELYRSGETGAIGDALAGFEMAIGAGLFDAHLNSYSANATHQLAVVLQLLVGRIQLDYVSPRFLRLYEEFTNGLGLTEDATLDELAARYQACGGASEYEYVLENYLVNYAYKTIFPFGSDGEIEREYLLMAAYFSVLKALITVKARRPGFDEAEAIRTVQIFVRAVEHCTTYPPFVFETLAKQGLSNAAGMAVLSQKVKSPECTGV